MEATKEEARKRKLRARIAARTRCAAPTYDPKEATRKAREAGIEARRRAVDPEGVLTEAERAVRAAHLLVARLAAGKLAATKRRRSGRRAA